MSVRTKAESGMVGYMVILVIFSLLIGPALA